MTIPLALLAQRRPDNYRLGPGDVLGVYIEGVLGERPPGPPVHVGPLVQSADQQRLVPTAGYPVPVRADGTISLPQAERIGVQGLSLDEAEDAIREYYTVKKKILNPGTERIMVGLLHARRYQVLVFRQEAPTFLPGANGVITSSSKRGTGHVVELPAYENDVLHAIARTGGLPGLDAYNEIVIFRDRFHNEQERAQLLHQFQPGACGQPAQACGLEPEVIRIPLRSRLGEPLPFRPDDVILYTGDVVFVEARDKEVFYTGGLLPAGLFELPRDRDLDVIEAISMVQGPLLNGAININNLSGNLIAPGIGSPSPGLLVVVRRLPGRGQIPIRVDLERALLDPRERILVQPGDMLILQEKPGQALARYMTQTLFNFSLAWQVIHETFATGVIDIQSPQLVPARIGITNFLTPP
jgi:protein involved in polysaccharide export with SLBB domain